MTRRPTGRQKAARIALKDLRRRFGNERGRAKHAPEDSGDDVESGDNMYKEIKATLKVEDWVGRVKAIIELWERGAQDLKVLDGRNGCRKIRGAN